MIKQSLPFIAFLWVLLALPLSHAQSKTETSGDVLRLLIPATAFAATLWYEDNSQQEYQGSWQLGKSLLATTVATLALKEMVDKERPNGECCEAFPSGHSAIAFSGATFIHRRYGLAYGAAAYGAASWVAYSRVYADQHAWEDVAAGAAIGMLSSWYFTTAYKSLQVQPIISREYIGLSFNAIW